MHGSMECHCQPYHLWVLALNEGTRGVLGGLQLPNVTYVPMAEVETAELRAVRPRRTWPEYVWTVKPEWILSVMQRVGAVTYVDGDGFFFGSPDPMFGEIGDAPLAVTPHRFPDRLSAYIQNGQFNGGFIYAREIDAIKEWAAQCLEWCFLQYDADRFVDQKYLNAWPDKWGAHVVDHPGVNLAPWNQERYEYSMVDGAPAVDGQSIIWYHFHQGLAPAYPLRPFVEHQIYGAYRAAMGAAEKRLGK
jgi:hypothetical protein